MPRFKVQRELFRPVVGEATQWRDLERDCDLGAGGLIKTRAAPDRLSVGAYSSRKPRGMDTDLLEILQLICIEAGRPEWRIKYQRRGTCVGQAAATCADIVMAVSHLAAGNKFPGRASVATMYAGSRVESGGQPGFWDGSNGSWVAKWANKWGVALLEELGLDDTNRQDDERLGIRWASSRYGVPEEFESLSQERPIVMTPLVTNTDEAAVAIEGGAPIIDCSNLIPTGKTDSSGLSPVRRSGGHATVFAAVRYHSGTKDFLYLNSWSEDWGDKGMVWISERDAQRILDQRDSYAFIGVTGLEPLNGLHL